MGGLPMASGRGTINVRVHVFVAPRPPFLSPFPGLAGLEGLELTRLMAGRAGPSSSRCPGKLVYLYFVLLEVHQRVERATLRLQVLLHVYHIPHQPIIHKPTYLHQ